MLPGWFGFGAAVDVFLSRHGEPGLELLQEMYRHWSFFRTLISNMDMVLFKSDVHIASRYAELMDNAKLREDVFGRIRHEMQRSIDHLLTITEQKELLESNPLLARAFVTAYPISTRLTTFNWKRLDVIGRAAGTGMIG